jgi:predicted anti-sigma-YlaC factor YlaD
MTDSTRPSLWRRIKGLMLGRMPLMITCEVFEGFILDYLEGDLSERQRAVFEFHLKICRECRDYLAAYERSMAIGKALFAEPAAPLPDEVPEDLVKAVLAAREA